MALNDRRIYHTEVSQNLKRRMFMGLEPSSQKVMGLNKALGDERSGHKYLYRKKNFKTGKWDYYYKTPEGKIVVNQEKPAHGATEFEKPYGTGAKKEQADPKVGTVKNIATAMGFASVEKVEHQSDGSVHVHGKNKKGQSVGARIPADMMKIAMGEEEKPEPKKDIDQETQEIMDIEKELGRAEKPEQKKKPGFHSIARVKETPHGRITMEVRRLKNSDESIDKKDAEDFESVAMSLKEGNNRSAKYSYNNMDTLARDNFVEIYTNNYKDTEAVGELATKLNIEFNRDAIKRAYGVDIKQKSQDKPESGKPIPPAEMSKLKKTIWDKHPSSFSKKPESFEDAVTGHPISADAETSQKLGRLKTFKMNSVPQVNPEGASETDLYIIENKGKKYLVDPQGYDYPRYMAEIK